MEERPDEPVFDAPSKWILHDGILEKDDRPPVTPISLVAIRVPTSADKLGARRVMWDST